MMNIFMDQNILWVSLLYIVYIGSIVLNSRFSAFKLQVPGGFVAVLNQYTELYLIRQLLCFSHPLFSFILWWRHICHVILDVGCPMQQAMLKYLNTGIIIVQRIRFFLWKLVLKMWFWYCVCCLCWIFFQARTCQNLFRQSTRNFTTLTAAIFCHNPTFSGFSWTAAGDLLLRWMNSTFGFVLGGWGLCSWYTPRGLNMFCFLELLWTRWATPVSSQTFIVIFRRIPHLLPPCTAKIGFFIWLVETSCWKP